MRFFAASCILLLAATLANAQPPMLKQEPNTWVKRSPLPGGPVSPSLGYEGSFGYDPIRKLLIRWAGHNQGGGGEQNAETWTYDPFSAKWGAQGAEPVAARRLLCPAECLRSGGRPLSAFFRV